MNRKLGHLIKAAIVALPLALPGVALAQSAGTSGSTDTSNPAAQDDATKGSLGQDKNLGNSNTQGSSGMSSGGTLDQTDKQNAGSLGSSTGDTGPGDIKTPPAGSLDTSGSAKSSDRGVGGDINKSDDTANMNSDETTTTTHKKIKKTVKRAAPSDLNNSNSNDVNR
jgi:hypothetical protein